MEAARDGQRAFNHRRRKPGGNAVVANGASNLQYATQLFIKTDLGVSAQSVGPKGNQSCQRRVVIDQPTFALVVDRHNTSWGSFQISPNTTISSFSVQLCDYEGSVVDLNGQNWSFSITISRVDLKFYKIRAVRRCGK